MSENVGVSKEIDPFSPAVLELSVLSAFARNNTSSSAYGFCSPQLA
jgi:hypothetical protein